MSFITLQSRLPDPPQRGKTLPTCTPGACRSTVPPTAHLDRQAVEQLFGVGERRARHQRRQRHRGVSLCLIERLEDEGCGGPYRDAITLRPGDMWVVFEGAPALAARMLELAPCDEE